MDVLSEIRRGLAAAHSADAAGTPGPDLPALADAAAGAAAALAHLAQQLRAAAPHTLPPEGGAGGDAPDRH